MNLYIHFQCPLLKKKLKCYPNIFYIPDSWMAYLSLSFWKERAYLFNLFLTISASKCFINFSPIVGVKICCIYLDFVMVYWSRRALLSNTLSLLRKYYYDVSIHLNNDNLFLFQAFQKTNSTSQHLFFLLWSIISGVMSLDDLNPDCLCQWL